MSGTAGLEGGAPRRRNVTRTRTGVAEFRPPAPNATTPFPAKKLRIPKKDCSQLFQNLAVLDGLSFMKSTLSRIIVLAVIASACTLARAQGGAAATPIEYLRPMKNSFSVGVRMIGGANVTFSGNLGVTPYTAAEWKSASGYTNGIVGADSSASDSTSGRPEYDRATMLLGTEAPGGVEGRFYSILIDGNNDPILDINGNMIITGDYLDYNENLTRNWSYSSQSQLEHPGREGFVGMSSYASEAAGAHVKASDNRAPGLEFTMSRVLQRFKRFEWGVTFGIGVAEFNAKTRQRVSVKLNALTDYYQVYSTGTDGRGTPTPGVSAITSGTTSFPSIVQSGTGMTGNENLVYEYKDSNGETLTSYGKWEETTPIGTTPAEENVESSTDGYADGFWQVKGVYYVMRIGPMVRIPIGRKFSMYVSGGYLGAYVGSKFRYDESVSLPEGTSISTAYTTSDVYGNATTIDRKSNQQYRGGYYFDANFEWWATTRTGFFAGVGYERLGSYTQTLHKRTATVKMDTGLGWRFGVITRF